MLNAATNESQRGLRPCARSDGKQDLSGRQSAACGVGITPGTPPLEGIRRYTAARFARVDTRLPIRENTL